MSDAGEEISERVLMMTMQELMKMSKESLIAVLAGGAQGRGAENTQSNVYTIVDNKGLWKDVEAELQKQNIPYKTIKIESTDPPKYTIAVPQNYTDKFEAVLDNMIKQHTPELQEAHVADTKAEPALTYKREEDALSVGDIERQQSDVINMLRAEGIDVSIKDGPVRGTAYVALSCEEGQSIIPPLMRVCEKAGVEPPVCVDMHLSEDAYGILMSEADKAGVLLTEPEFDTQGMPFEDDGLRHVRMYRDDFEQVEQVLNNAKDVAKDVHSPAEFEFQNARENLMQSLSNESLKIQGMADLELSKTNYELVQKYCEKNGVLLVNDGSLASGKLAPDDGKVHAKVLLAQKEDFAKTMKEVVRDLDEDSPDRARVVEKAGKVTEAKMESEKLDRKSSFKDRTERSSRASSATEQARQFAKDKHRDMER